MRPRHLLLLAAGLLLAAPELARGAETSPANLVLVTVPSLRPDRIGAAGNTRKLTPAIDELAARATLLARARTPTPATEAALASVFTGRRPRSHGLLNPSLPGAGLPTLAGRLRDAGLATIAVVPDATLLEIETFAEGFENVHVGADEAAPALAARALTALAERKSDDRGFFLWIHLQDCEAPYRPGLADLVDLMADGVNDIWRFPLDLAQHDGQKDALPPASANGPARRVDFYLNAYDATVRQVDRGVDRLQQGLVDSGDAERTLFVLAGLHGEALGEHGVWFTHGRTLYEEELNVPLLFAGPGIKAHVEMEHAAFLTDIAPTIEGFFDLPPIAREGDDLSPRLGTGRFASSRHDDAVLLQAPFSRALLFESRFKLIVEPPRPPQVTEPAWWPAEERRELYDLLLDPLEASAVQDRRMTIANELRLLIRDRYPPVPGTPPAEDRSRRR